MVNQEFEISLRRMENEFQSKILSVTARLNSIKINNPNSTTFVTQINQREDINSLESKNLITRFFENFSKRK